jgi:hypothetical protein
LEVTPVRPAESAYVIRFEKNHLVVQTLFLQIKFNSKPKLLGIRTL